VWVFTIAGADIFRIAGYLLLGLLLPEK